MRIYEADTRDLLDSQERDPLLCFLTNLIVRKATHACAPGYGKVLDVGCGIGRTALALAGAGFSVVGIDENERAIQIGRASALQHSAATRLSFEVGDISRPPQNHFLEAFDLAVCSEVLEHVADASAVIDYMYRTLRPAGIVIVTTPNDPRQWTVADEYAGHVKRFTAAELKLLLQRFEVLDFGSEGFPFQRLAMSMYNLLASPGRKHEFGEFSTHWAYRAYRRTMPPLLRIDHLFHRLGLGTTLIAVARRCD